MDEKIGCDYKDPYVINYAEGDRNSFGDTVFYAVGNVINQVNRDGVEINSRLGMTKEIMPIFLSIDSGETIIKDGFNVKVPEQIERISGKHFNLLKECYEIAFFNSDTDFKFLWDGGPESQINYPDLQIDFVVRSLVEDKNSRRAVVSLWWPSKNPACPCVTEIIFYIRDEKLIVYTTIRSSEVRYKLARDILHIRIFQELVLKKLKSNNVDVKVGTMFFTILSAHLYLKGSEGYVKHSD